MPAAAASIPPTSAALYCLRARRIRHRHGRNPARKLAALRELACDAEAVQPTPVAGAASATRSFTELVRRRVTGPVLPYSQRLYLLRRAAGYHLTPFHANLLIAAVQYEQGRELAVAPTRRRGVPIVIPVLAILLIELLTLWWVVA